MRVHPIIRKIFLPEKKKIKELEPTSNYLWCLDNGHGALTQGKRSPMFDDGSRFFEYEFNRDIVNRICELLDQEGITYYNIIPETNVGNDLKLRVDRANNKESNIPKIYLSVHSNAGPAATPESWQSASGLETWYYNNSPEGEHLATIFQEELVDELRWKDRGIKSKEDGQFYVLRKTKMPAVLTENGFYNNKKEAELLMDDSIRQRIAEAHVKAIKRIEQENLI